MLARHLGQRVALHPEGKAEIGKLKAEKDRMLAKLESAQARLKIQEQLDGLARLADDGDDGAADGDA